MSYSVCKHGIRGTWRRRILLNISTPAIGEDGNLRLPVSAANRLSSTEQQLETTAVR